MHQIQVFSDIFFTEKVLNYECTLAQEGSVIMQWCVLIGCGKEVFCRQGDFQSMLRLLGLKYYTHAYLRI